MGQVIWGMVFNASKCYMMHISRLSLPKQRSPADKRILVHLEVKNAFPGNYDIRALFDKFRNLTVVLLTPEQIASTAVGLYD